ncbi:MAG TPA: BamA/TamA family outer membrane protein [Gemmatimonadaceae bacterium]|nr:BamA/TamA family outer membrane protein [Gemmatimonadaceae bacterium]
MVQAVEFVGVHSVNVDQLQASIATQPTRCKSALLAPFCLFHFFIEEHRLDHLELARDVLRIRVYYWRRGYRQTQVDTVITPQEGGVAVAFQVTEGPPTAIKTLTVLSPETVIPPKRYPDILLVRAGDPLDLLALDSSLVLFRNALWDEGYADASVRDTIALSDSERVARVTITIDPMARTTVQQVTVSGNTQVASHTIRNMLSFHRGDIFRRKELLESQRTLYQSNLFRRAIITVPQSVDSAKQVHVAVQEAPLHEVRASAGFNTIDFFQVEGRFSDYNWHGKARRLELRAVIGNLLAPQLNGRFIFRDITPASLTGEPESIYLQPNWTASAELTQPFFHSPKNSLGLDIFAHRQSAPAVFVDRGYGASASFTRAFAPQSPTSVVYRYELTEVEAGDIYFCVNFGVCETPTITALRGRHALSPLSVGIIVDHTNSSLDPTTGYRAEIDLEHASAATFSDYRYNRASADLSKYIPVGASGTLAGRLVLGWVHALPSTNQALGVADTTGAAIVHPRKRFYAGGSQSVRGYGENQLGPRILTVDPQTLLDSGCTAATIADASCNPNFVPSSAFTPQPLGADALIEGSLEYRFPLVGSLGGAVFVDAALLGEHGFTKFSQAAGAITPGFGIRYYSPLGPIRVDLGIRPNLTEHLPVITQVPESTGPATLVQLRTEKFYNPLEDTGTGIRQVLARLTLHLSIGQAF